jgi:hypothetical protein
LPPSAGCLLAVVLGLGARLVRSLGNIRRLEWKGVFGWSSVLDKWGNMVAAEMGRRCRLPPLVFVDAEARGLLYF